MSAAVLRLKRKASSEPLEGFVIALKKSKSEVVLKSNEVYFKFAATLTSEKDSVKDHIKAALTKEKEEKNLKWRDPKSVAISKRNTNTICDKLKKESKAASEKNRLDLLNNRRLIFTENLPIDDSDDSFIQNAEVRELFKLYDIIEENEDPKKQAEDKVSSITCNGKPLVSEKSSDYVYDVYIADGQVDESFVKNAVSLRPCTMTNDDIYSGDSEDNSEVYEDEDDSNDENNWRNEYPEDEESHSNSSENEYDEHDKDYHYNELQHAFNQANLDDSRYSSDDEFCSKIDDSSPEFYGDSD